MLNYLSRLVVSLYQIISMCVQEYNSKARLYLCLSLLYPHMLGQKNAFQHIVIFTLVLIIQMFIVKISSNCSDIVARYIIRKIHQLDSQCPLGHKLQQQQ